MAIVLVVINHSLTILYSVPIFIRCINEILIIIGISCRNYSIYISGVYFCVFMNFVVSFFILALILTIFDNGIENSEEGLLFSFIILIALLIYIEFSIYVCYIKKVKNHCNLTIDIIYPIQTSNTQDNDGLYNPVQNIDNQGIAAPVISPEVSTDNKETIYKITPHE